MITIGIISDTHGQLRPQAVEALHGSDYIVHGGDIGKQSIINTLSELAPVTAVRGNIDKGPLADTYPHDATLDINDTRIYTIHIIDDLKLDPVSEGFQVVIYGHSHKPEISTRNEVLYINPGSAGPRRFSLPVTVARLIIDGQQLSAKIIELNV